MVRRADGALLSAAIAPYPAMLYASVRGQRWEEAVRLCRLETFPRTGQMICIICTKYELFPLHDLDFSGQIGILLICMICMICMI